MANKTRIIWFDIKTDVETVYLRLNKSEDLATAIEIKKAELNKEKNKYPVEIYKEENNILITEKGYYVAVFDV